MPPRVAPVILLVTLASLLVACASPPQVLEISPQRAASDVRSSQAVRVRFDRPMDRASVAAHFRIEPTVHGTLTWPRDDELAFEHVPLKPSSEYLIVLEPGYRDAKGGTNSLRHSWRFRTESAPTLTGANPGAGDRGVDPAAYVSLTFSREMDQGTLAEAIALTPAVPLAIHQDPNEPRRVILAPQSLLQPRTPYELIVSRDARDVDGNRLDAAAEVSFTTGSFRPLRHWISFIAEPSEGSDGVGVWIVDDNRVPRQLINSPVTSFTWSADGSSLLLRNPAGTWTDQPLDGTATRLPIAGPWADYLATGRGYAFLDEGRLRLLQPDGAIITVATGVTDAAVAPGGERLAFVTHDSAAPERSAQIDGYDVELRARYRLQAEPGPVDGLAWSPDGQSLAYRLEAGDPAHRQVRVRSLRDGGTVTVATGAVSAPAWQADRQHVLFSATIPTPGGPVSRAFRFAVSDGSPHALSVATAMPGNVPVDELSPSPDGHQLAVVADAGGRPGIWTMNADGSGLTQLTESGSGRFPYSCRAVAWTPV